MGWEQEADNTLHRSSAAIPAPGSRNDNSTGEFPDST